MNWKEAWQYLAGTHPRLQPGEPIEWCVLHDAPRYNQEGCLERFTVWFVDRGPCQFVDARLLKQ